MNILIKDVQALIFEDERAVVKKTDIGIKGCEITEIGEVKDDFAAQRVIHAKNMLAMPVINTHTHLSIIFFEIMDDMPLWDWLKKVWPKRLTKERYQGSILGIAELRSGVTGFLDMYFLLKRP